MNISYGDLKYARIERNVILFLSFVSIFFSFFFFSFIIYHRNENFIGHTWFLDNIDANIGVETA